MWFRFAAELSQKYWLCPFCWYFMMRFSDAMVQTNRLSLTASCPRVGAMLLVWSLVWCKCLFVNVGFAICLVCFGFDLSGNCFRDGPWGLQLTNPWTCHRVANGVSCSSLLINAFTGLLSPGVMCSFKLFVIGHNVFSEKHILFCYCLLMNLFVCLPVCLSIRPSVSPSLCPCFCMSVCLMVWSSLFEAKNDTERG